MASGNTVTLSGNLTRDPELKFLDSGAAVASFGVAVNRRWQDQQGEWQEEAHFFDVTAWRDLAENIASTLVQGDRVIIEGRLQFRSWENTEGEKRSKVEVVADEVGASLRWATANVTKNERKDDGRNSGSGNRGGSSRGGGSSTGSSRGGGSRSDSRPDYEEEPF